MQAYFTGQTITGSIQVVLREPKWYQYIGVSLEGKGKVHWTESHSTGSGDSERTEIRHYSDNETYADLLVIVWGDRGAPQPTRLDPGTLNFPFQLTVPPQCPPTYESITGKINYRLFAIVSSQVNEYRIETPIVISSLIDLNLRPELSQPVHQSTVKSITSCCCFNAGEAEVSLKMPRTGFCVVQERIPVTFECRNGSSQQITVRAEVSQNTVYNAHGHTKSSSDTIGNFSCQILASGSDTKSVEFELPPSVNLGFTTRIIYVSHSVRLWISHSLGMNFFAGPTLAVPVVIGNVPFRGTQTGLQGSTQQPAGYPAPQEPPSNLAGYPPQGPAPPVGFVFPPSASSEPTGVPSTPPNAQLQSQAPPSYGAVISGAEF